MTEIEIGSDDRPELDKRLGDGLYAFNSTTTSIDDGTLLSASISDDDGDIVAGISGHTWGQTCEISRLWVHESKRHSGIGSRLMHAAEAEAIKRGCRQIVLSTHSFQAPRFYERLGFRRIATIPNYPSGFDQYIYLKELDVP